jgi:hypothetical protein
MKRNKKIEEDSKMFVLTMTENLKLSMALVDI